jgi:argininosuccinate synthase
MTPPPSPDPSEPEVRRIVLAYSSGLAATDAISWLADAERAEVVTLTLDLGQGRALEALRDRALAAGAVRAHVLEVGDAFANQFVLPALKAGALYHDGRSMMSGLERALLAEKLVEIARIEQAATVAHGCSPTDRRIALAVQTLRPGATVLALPNDVAGTADCEIVPYAATGGEKPVEPAFVELTFTNGAPAAINGIPMPLRDLIDSINMLAGPHGLGRGNRFEPPSSVVLYAAHQSLVAASVSDVDEWKSTAAAYAGIIDRGEWFGEARAALNASIESRQSAITGTIRLKFFNGACEIVDTKVAPAGKILKVTRKR